MDNPRAVNGPVVDKIFVTIPLVPNKLAAVGISAKRRAESLFSFQCG